jgi:hypothetical protein
MRLSLRDVKESLCVQIQNRPLVCNFTDVNHQVSLASI